ncbi:hypothetical protein QAD02_014986 [Eretmocerus hayati]|uniref:Uncharacterized protein n=1 Tax=Eretmocerus hayati TaxID=131215 RepID=A0ACC2P7D2_9HYME|nr:hypothetical protein QAD02_014986 [Eretmocerus hayati]
MFNDTVLQISVSLIADIMATYNVVQVSVPRAQKLLWENSLIIVPSGYVKPGTDGCMTVAYPSRPFHEDLISLVDDFVVKHPEATPPGEWKRRNYLDAQGLLNRFTKKEETPVSCIKRKPSNNPKGKSGAKKKSTPKTHTAEKAKMSVDPANARAVNVSEAMKNFLYGGIATFEEPEYTSTPETSSVMEENENRLVETVTQPSTNQDGMSTPQELLPPVVLASNVPNHLLTMQDLVDKMSEFSTTIRITQYKLSS